MSAYIRRWTGLSLQAVSLSSLPRGLLLNADFLLFAAAIVATLTGAAYMMGV